MNQYFINYILQVTTVGPEGNKLIWVFLFIIAITTVIFLVKGKLKIRVSNFSSSLLLQVTKNKVYHPTVIHLKITNRNKTAVTGLVSHPREDIL